MKIALASDHAGVSHRERIAEWLEDHDIAFREFGPAGSETVDYPDVAYQVGLAVAVRECDYGILICGTGTGVSIAANKLPGILAASCHTEYSTEYARRHDHANVLCLGGREISEDTAVRLAEVWLNSEPEGGRHNRRIRKIFQIEREVLQSWGRFRPDNR